MPTTHAMVDALRGAGLRVTSARRSVTAAIGEHDGHFTAEELLTAASHRAGGVGRATVFRTLETLTRLGLVERVDLPSGEHAYVACRPDEHHHHVVCSSCGRSAEVGDVGLGPVLQRVGQSSGFRIDSHRLELFGVCGECRTNGG